MLNDDDNTTKNLSGVTAAPHAILFPPAKREEKYDPVFDIPRIPFDANRHQQALALGQGTCEIDKCENYMLVRYLKSNSRGNGYGTAQFRNMMQHRSHVVVDIRNACQSPHIFYLYMGMVPRTSQVKYLKHQYGSLGELVLETLDALAEYDEWSVKILTQVCDEVTIKNLRLILQLVTGITPTKDPFNDIIANRQLMLNLKEKQLDYATEIFIPAILKILQDTPTGEFPDTRALGEMYMDLTEQGYTRWKFVIDNNLEFVPFRKFEHLGLSKEQQMLLNDIINPQRAGIKTQDSL